jgi:hypothetical protein
VRYNGLVREQICFRSESALGTTQPQEAHT